jgi:hypothetical protein
MTNPIKKIVFLRGGGTHSVIINPNAQLSENLLNAALFWLKIIENRIIL